MDPSVRRIIESCELSHAEFVMHYQPLKRRIDDALAGHPAASEWLIGPSRVGKSMLINNLAREYPETKVEGVRRIPVLVVPVPSPVSPKEMPKSVLAALGMPTVRGNSGDLFLKMERLLKLAGTKVLLFEEASHIVEVGTKMPPRAAGDWFKQLMERLGLTIILFGVPHLEKLYQSNEQLRKRSQARRQFRPYDSTDKAEYFSFAQCVMTYADVFDKAGWPIDMPRAQLVGHCYLLSGGLVGVVSAFMNRLAYDLEPQKRRLVTAEDCARAMRSIESAGHPDHPAFTRAEVTPAELEQAHITVLAEAKLPRRR
ncbi:ATP-binding protein [Variovorax ginsengisoli]|uniref:ATP-binding protein n=1 Tax=Variovorax guangxiensis TaxID=1775474 RepID=A0A502DXL9_9BURK|nr:ATP-binding protein [Variovorax ginsengisoli]TPG29439.1 ATP-binding protein [Variovorax guangxiensis]